MESEHRNNQLVRLKLEIAEHGSLSRFQHIFDDPLLVGFLRGKKFIVRDALECLERYIIIRTVKHAQFTKKYLLPSNATILENRGINILQRLDHNGRAVVFGQTKLWNTKTHTLYDTIAEHVFIVDEMLRSYLKATGSNEIVLVINFDGWTVGQASQVTPRAAMLNLDFILKSVPIRPAAIHLINGGSLIELLVRLVKKFMPEKIANRIFVHSNLPQLHEYLYPTILPKSLGGELEDEDAFQSELPDRIRGQEEFYRKLIQFTD
ncbi:clavesin-2 [Folsomia candida]|uniref:Clavesin-2 n=1 Tax=Folsomia candida TaxID=158441 RepID=A0A226DWN5_FOLCA|nr:clavesin-2 [Folsomia candida]OXA49438.1 Clavesin-2 [Folsomia candida]